MHKSVLLLRRWLLVATALVASHALMATPVGAETDSADALGSALDAHRRMDYALSKSLYLEVLKSLKPGLDRDMVLLNLGDVCMEIHDKTSAERFYKQSVDELVQRLGANSVQLIPAMDKLQGFYSETEQREKSFLILKKLVELRRRAMPNNSRDLISNLRDMHSYCVSKKNWHEAAVFATNLVEIYVASPAYTSGGDGHEYQAMLAYDLLQDKRPDEATKVLNAIGKTGLPAGDSFRMSISIVKQQAIAAICWKLLRRDEEARACLERVEQLLRRQVRRKHIETSLLEQLAQTCLDFGDIELARGYLRRSESGWKNLGSDYVDSLVRVRSRLQNITRPASK